MALRSVRSALVGSLVLAASLMACGDEDAPAGDAQPSAGKSGGAGASAAGGSAGALGGSGASGSSIAGGGVAGSGGAAAGKGGAAGASAGKGGASAGNAGKGGTSAGNAGKGGANAGNAGNAGNGGADAGNAGNGGANAGNGGADAGNGGADAGNGGADAGSGGSVAGSGGSADAGGGGAAGGSTCRVPDGCALGALIGETNFAVGSSGFGLVNGKICPGGPSGPEGRCLVEYDLGKIALVVDADRLGAQGELPVRVADLPVRINVALGVRTTRMTYNAAATCQTSGLLAAKAKVKLTFSQPLPEGEALVLGCSSITAPTIQITIDDPPVVGCDTLCEPATACAPTDNAAPAMVNVARNAIQDTLRDALLSAIAARACTTP